MELRSYCSIIWRRIWVVIALVLIVVAVSLVLREPTAPAYQASLRFIVGVPPEPLRGDYYTYDDYYTWLASEYLADDFSEVVKSGAFATDVTNRLKQDGESFQVPAGVIQGATVAEKQHRILSMYITWGNSAQLEGIASAAAQALREDASKYFSQLGEAQAQVHLIDPPVVTQIPVSLRQKLDLPMRLVLALAAGIFLVFLLYYLDDTVCSPQEVEGMGLAVLGTIPPLKRRIWPPSRWRKTP
jgi:capsular polysaccharide biosynthesis protein